MEEYEAKKAKFNTILSKYFEDFNNWPFQDVIESSEGVEIIVDGLFADKLIEEFGSTDIINTILKDALVDMCSN